MSLADVLGWLGNAQAVAVLALLGSALCLGRRGRPEAARWAWDVLDYPLIGSNVAFAAQQALRGDWVGAAISGTIAAFFIWSHHRRRRNRKRAAKLAGYKARAALAALVRKAREAGKPRPVLRPIPGGVR